MIFKGASNNQVTHLRAGAGGQPPSGATTRRPTPGARRRSLFTGTITQQPAASPYGPTLTVPNTQTANPALDDFYATVQRGSVFRAKCPAGASPLKIQAVFDYTAAGDPTDTISPPYAGTTDPCPP